MKINKQKKSEFAERLRAKCKSTVDLKYVFTFGKYVGHTLHSVMLGDIEYITWCMAEKIITLDKEALDEYAEIKIQDNVRRHKERAERERREAEQKRAREEFNFKFNGHASYNFDDFFSDFTRKFNRGFRDFGSIERGVRDTRPVHPAFLFDNLPAKQKAAKLLKLEGQITKETIRQKYVEVVKQFHPDKYANAPKEVQDFVNEFTKKIIESYEFLKKMYAL